MHEGLACCKPYHPWAGGLGCIRNISHRESGSKLVGSSSLVCTLVFRSASLPDGVWHGSGSQRIPFLPELLLVVCQSNRKLARTVGLMGSLFLFSWVHHFAFHSDYSTVLRFIACAWVFQASPIHSKLCYCFEFPWLRMARTPFHTRVICVSSLGCLFELFASVF